MSTDTNTKKETTPGGFTLDDEDNESLEGGETTQTVNGGGISSFEPDLS